MSRSDIIDTVLATIVIACALVASVGYSHRVDTHYPAMRAAVLSHRGAP